MPPNWIYDPVYGYALESLARNEPVGMVPTEEGIWITSVNPMPITSADEIVICAIAICMRARREAAKHGCHPI